jgi:ubiquinone/menaquinone biosynthesis C-methylase UbiE
MKVFDNDKQEAIKQWTEDPCGKIGAKGLEEGTLEFYERINQNRYEEYAPWMKNVMDFAQFRDKKILEIGFGMGTDLFQFASNSAEVFGIDLSPKHLEISQKRFELYGIKANLQIADAENMPFNDSFFDAVYSFGVIHHTPDMQKTIEETYRVLKPGGKAIISVYNRNSAYYYFVLMAKYILFFRFLKETYRQTLSRIEYRENSDACPLVILSSRSEYLKRFSNFREVSIECHHLHAHDFGPFKKIIPKFLVRKLENKLGWYLVAKCLK